MSYLFIFLFLVFYPYQILNSMEITNKLIMGMLFCSQILYQTHEYYLGSSFREFKVLALL